MSGESFSVDLDRLRRVLADARSDLEAWAQALTSDASAEARALVSTAAQQQVEYEGLQAREQALLAEVERLGELQAQKLQQLDAHAEEAQRAAAAAEGLPERVAALAADVSRSRGAAGEAEAAAALRSAALSRALADVSAAVDAYARRLGLTLSAAPGEFTLSFTLVSERAPDRAFRATLAVPPRRGGAYFLARTEPRLGRERHDALAALLAQAAGGAEAGLPRFVAAVRRAFVEECEGGGAEGAEAGAAVG